MICLSYIKREFLIKSNPELLKIVVQHRQTFFRYNAMNYDVLLTDGVRTLPTEENWPDWRGDYNRSAVMIYNNRPTFEELMLFAEKFEKEFNQWVSEMK